MKFAIDILASQKTVFSRTDLDILLPPMKSQSMANFLMRAKKKGLLRHMHRGLWSLLQYDRYELACKLRKWSYISLETILYEAGVIFQFSPNTIHCMSNDSRVFSIDNFSYIYHKISDAILYNPIGIRMDAKIARATPERALCDLIYLYPKTQVENIAILHKQTLLQIVAIYPKSTRLALTMLLNDAQSQ